MSASKAVGDGCKTTHNISLFSSTALQQRPHQRLCMGCEGTIWICPHITWDRAHSKEVQKQGCRTKKSVAKCGCPNVTSPPTEGTSLSIFYPVLAMPQGSAFHTASVQKALRALDMNICPHQRFGDPDALNAFHSGRSRLEDPWSLDKRVRCTSRGSRSVHGVEVNCESCETRTAFFLSESHDETTTLWAQESRRIAKSAESVTDPTWISYLYTPAKIQLPEKEWKQTRWATHLPPSGICRHHV